MLPISEDKAFSSCLTTSLEALPSLRSPGRILAPSRNESTGIPDIGNGDLHELHTRPEAARNLCAGRNEGYRVFTLVRAATG